MNANKQTILNAGGDAYFSHVFLKHWTIDNITVKESWSKYKNIPLQNLDEIILFIVLVILWLKDIFLSSIEA